MLNIGSFRAKDCHGLTRRAFVGMAAAAPFACDAKASAAEYGEALARSVIMVWLWGGPSQIDTFDPKPRAPSEYRGPFQPIATRTPGAQFSELLPRLAARSDQFAIVRSTTTSSNHSMATLTGYPGRPDGEQEPNFGSIITRHKRSATLPSFISVAPTTTLGHGFDSTRNAGYGGGRLGSAANPFIVHCDSVGEVRMPSLQLLSGMTPARLADRRLLLAQLDHAQRRLHEASAVEQWRTQVADAHGLLTATGASRAFELNRENEATRDSYGRTTFGQSLLLARRLAEAGVPYVQVNWSLGVDGLEEGSNMGWDTHRNNFGQLMDYHGPVFDRAMSALLDDLRQRGLLESTLVVAMGEMGRTPTINRTGGRDHHSTNSTFWAGGGVRGGRIVGATDARGGSPNTRPVTALMGGTTIAELMGMNAEFRARMKVLEGGTVIDELF
jgi:hypothetical protein